MKIFKKYRILQYAAVFLLITFCYIFERLISPESFTGLRIGMGALAGLTAVYDLYLLKTKKLTPELLIKTLFFAGIIMRIGYMLYTPASVRSHDLWEFDTEGYGHAGYILTLHENRMLPQTNIRQYYQQPFFYILGASISDAIAAILGNGDYEMIVDSAKIISGASSCFVLLMAEPLCEELELKGWFRSAAVAFVAFNPSFYLSERISPDMLATMLMTVALLYTLRWYKNPDWKNTVILAVTYGLAMMTKLSAGAVAVFTAGVFILKLAESAKESKAGKLIVKFIVFGIISLPTGLWYSVRNYRKFSQPLGYVLEIPSDHALYTGDHSFMQRLILPDLPNLFLKPYAEVFDDYNLWTYMVKSSLFGEFKFEVIVFVPIVLLLAAAAICIPVVTGVVNGTLKFKENKNHFFFSAAVIIFMISLISFQIKYPNGCSMDFRYMTFMVVPAAILAGKYCEATEKSWMKVLMASSVMVYSVFSCLMYTMIK